MLAWLPAVLLAAVFAWTGLHDRQLTPLEPVPVQMTAGESVEISFASGGDKDATAVSSAPDVALLEVCGQKDGAIVCRLTAQREGQALISCAAGQTASPDFAITVQAPPAQPSDAPEPGAGAFVASATGEKYHLPDCASARQIKEENRIYFQSAQQAEAEGYTPCARCLG